MTWLRVAAWRLLGMLSGRRRDADLDEELASHLDFLTQANLRSGMTADEARRQARLAFGGLEAVRESYRDTRGFPLLESVLRDIRHALRMMRNRPGFTAAVVAVLGLGIGAATAMFSILNTLLLQPLAYPGSGRLVLIGDRQQNQNRGAGFEPARYPNFADWRAQSQAFTGMAAFQQTSLNVSAGAGPARVRAERVSEDFFPVLGVQPRFGRVLLPSDFSAGAPPVVVLSHRYWRLELGARPEAVGSVVRVEGQPATVIGVMPDNFRATMLEGNPRLWTPLIPGAEEIDRNAATVTVIARLKPGVSLERARSELETIARRLELAYPASNRELGVNIESMREHFARASRAPVARMLVTAAAILLLIACANVANLLLVRGLDRGKEIALRLAMGAGRARLVRQLLLENMVLALAGGLAGLACAYWAVVGISKFSAPLLADAGVDGIRIDGRVLSFALALSAVTGLVFGILPAVRGSTVRVVDALKEAGLRHSAVPSKRRLTGILVTLEIALTLVLLVTGGLVLASVRHAWGFDWGFPLENRLVAGVSLSRQTYADPARRNRLLGGILERLNSTPGVRSAAFSASLPTAVMYATVPVKTAAGSIRTSYRVISPGYLETLSLPVRRGRNFDSRDTAGSARVALVNDSAAAALWPGKNPLGESIELNGVWRTVVGVAPNTANRGLLGQPGHEVLVPHTQEVLFEVTLLAHHDPGIVWLGPAVPKLIHEFDGDQPVSRVRSLEEAAAEARGPIDFVLVLVGAFAAVALALAVTGVYGVAAFSVSTRTREIGIRMALGARPNHVLSGVLTQGLRWAAAGMILGAAGAVAIARLLIARVWWAKAGVPLPILLAALALGAAALLACYLPARRATRIHPAEALRAE